MNRLFFSACAIAITTAAAIAPTAASATAFTFDFTKLPTTTGLYQATVNGTALTVKVSAWHADDTSSAVTTDPISAATLGTYQGAGLGVLYGNDNDANGTHQIDNVGSGEDFLMLQFSQDVALSSVSRNVYSIKGASCCDSDASYWGDATNVLGSPSSSTSIDLTKYVLDESLWTSLPGGGSAGVTSVSSSVLASVWMVGAALNQNNDGFKLAGMTVNTASAAAVPEPASWAMMVCGFGLVGGAVRRKKSAVSFA